MIGIYKITNPSNKIYIGQSWNIEKRLKGYKTNNNYCKNQTKLYNSFQKYGWENHQFDIIKSIEEPISQESLNEYEIEYWEYYIKKGFEMLNIREPGSRGKLSEETKKKISKPRSEQAKLNMKGILKPNAGGKGKLKPKGFGKIISIKRKGWNPSIEWREKISKALKGKYLSKEHKDKIKIATTGLIKSQETKQKMSLARKGLIIKGKDILQYDLQYNFIREWPSVKEAAEFLKLKPATISNNLTNLSKSAGGYIWKHKII